MKRINLFFVALVIMLGLAASGCYYEREYEHPRYHHRYQHDDDHHYHRDYGHRDYGRGDDDDD